MPTTQEIVSNMDDDTLLKHFRINNEVYQHHVRGIERMKELIEVMTEEIDKRDLNEYLG